MSLIFQYSEDDVLTPIEEAFLSGIMDASSNRDLDVTPYKTDILNRAYRRGYINHRGMIEGWLTIRINSRITN